MGQNYAPPFGELRNAQGAPLVFAQSDDVLPNQSFEITGEGLKDAELFCWGPSATQPGGQKWPIAIQTRNDSVLVATIPEAAPSGLYLVWAGRGGQWSAPLRLNAPQLWWSSKTIASAGDTVRAVGRNLAHKPDNSSASLYLSGPGNSGRWLTPARVDKYFLDVTVPSDLPVGKYRLWVHCGSGGALGWSNPLPIEIHAAAAPQAVRRWDGKDPGSLQTMLQHVSRAGGGTVAIPAGRFVFPTTLLVPDGVRLSGEGSNATILALAAEPSGELPHAGASPNERRAAIWVRGNRTAIARLTVVGNARVNWGVIAEHPDGLTWLDGLALEDVRIEGEDSRGGESGAIRLQSVIHPSVTKCELHGRAPLFVSGVRHGWFVHNRLVPDSRYGGGAEGAILGRNEPLSQSVFEDNVLANPVGGGPQVRRLIWVSTGRGSVNDNLFLSNRAENPRFSGVAATDQNVGETILLESKMRYAYFGAPASAATDSVAIPASAPFLPPVAEDGTPEPAAPEYYVVVVGGRGIGQVRRVARREDRRFVLDSPWRVPPDTGSKILISTLFARNLILENETFDGMTGIQLWIGGWENVIARNRVARERRQGIYLYAATNPIAEQMPPTWNRGIGILLFNTVEENQVENAQDGIFLNSNNGKAPVEWPRAIGNILRRNTAAGSRGFGIRATSGASSPLSVTGTVVEFNVVRDQPVGISLAEGTNAGVVRRNIIYVWDAFLLQQNPVGVQVLGDNSKAAENDAEPRLR